MRLWAVAGAAVSVIGLAAVAAVSFLGGGSGPAHVVSAPFHIGSYVRRPQLEKQMDAQKLQQEVLAKGGGQASHVVSAVYENNVSGAASPQIVLFVGGNLTGESPSAVIASFTDQFKGAKATSAGSLGGAASCVDAQQSATGVALCTWADNDTFGVVMSPTMGTAQLAGTMRALRLGVERPVK